DAGEVARRDVAHGVAACLAVGHAGFGDPGVRLRRVGNLDEVELEVLPRRDVAEAARPRVGHVGQRIELVGRDDALRRLDAEHVQILDLPLPVGPAHQAEPPPIVARDLAPLVLAEHVDELVDVRLLRERFARASYCCWMVMDCHVSSPARNAWISCGSAAADATSPMTIALGPSARSPAASPPSSLSTPVHTC